MRDPIKQQVKSQVRLGGADMLHRHPLVYGVIALAINYGDRQNNIILLTLDHGVRRIYQQI